jgi:hypothetical protein
MNTELHQYTECGLENIYVQGLKIEDDGGHSYIHIPAIGELHCLIAKSLLEEERNLTGKEFYFLRAELGMSIEAIAEQLSVDSTTLLQWQKTDCVSDQLDFTFRQFFKQKYQQENQNLPCWKQNSQIPSTYSKVAETTSINIKYDETGYHLLAA